MINKRQSTQGIKKDLKELRKNIRYIQSYKDAERLHRERIALLEGMGKQSYAKEIKRERELLAKLNPSKHIIEAGLVEERYIDAIEKLSPIDKTIIIETYLNGKPYWKTGEELGYTEEGIRKRISRCISKMAKGE